MYSDEYLRKACMKENHASQNRAMSSDDFNSHCRKNYPDVYSAVSGEIELK